jgi:uncharacterized membrane protein
MATLSAWKFENADDADRAEKLLVDLQKRELIQVHDAATVSWEAGRKKPKTRQAVATAGLGALSGSFWGMLFGLLFFVPLLGAAVGAAAGGLAGALTDVGINDDFINSVRKQVVPGTSALFVLTSGAVQDKVLDAFRDAGLHPQLITTNLSQDEEARLQLAFAENA